MEGELLSKGSHHRILILRLRSAHGYLSRENCELSPRDESDLLTFSVSLSFCNLVYFSSFYLKPETQALLLLSPVELSQQQWLDP